jgi:hypothetical protein
MCPFVLLLKVFWKHGATFGRQEDTVMEVELAVGSRVRIWDEF